MSTSPKHLGKYELQMRLGQGGMAEVWKGFDPQLKRSVAIKFLHANLRSDPDFANRFEREGQAIAALRHPNIVQIYDFLAPKVEDENQVAYMVMDYIEGLTLADYLHRTSYAGTIPSPDEIVYLFTSLGLAVDYAHQHGMIHRDIKPANVLLDTRNTVHNSMGEPILTDFGIVKMLGAATITSTGISMGTPLYISPEQIHGQVGNEKSDIYALGVILYEMCTGEPPYRGDNPYVILAQRVTGPPEPPSQRNPDISLKLDEVILRCLTMDPKDRFESASQLTAALAEAFDIPIPDMVRRTLSSSHIIKPPTSALPPQSTPTHIEELPAVPPDILKGTVYSNNKSLMGGETVLSDTGGMLISAPKRSAQVASHILNPEVSQITNNETIISEIDPMQVPTPKSPTSHKEQPSDRGSVQTISSPLEDLPSTPATQQPTPVDLPVSQSITTPLQPVHVYKHWLSRIILLIVLIGAGVSTYAIINRNRDTPPQATFVGAATFLSSGQLDTQNIPFVNDQVQVHLYGVPTLTSGQRYYAWAQDHTNTTTTIFLGALQDHQGNATLSYTDSLHRNLLAYVNSFLVTEQAANITPDHPSQDKQQWRYTATIPQALSTLDHVSYLDHLRHLLVSEPTLEQLQLHNGIAFWLLNNVQELSENALAARDSNNPQEIRQLLANLLYYLDGPCASQELQNTASSKVLENTLTAHAASISLLDCAQGTNHQGYLTFMQDDLNGIARTPGARVQEMQRAVHVNNNLNTIRGQLQQVRTQVLQLAHLDNEQLQHSQKLRSALANQANYTLGGQFDPLTQTFQPSIQQICSEITFLAHFDVSQYRVA